MNQPLKNEEEQAMSPQLLHAENLLLRAEIFELEARMLSNDTSDLSVERKKFCESMATGLRFQAETIKDAEKMRMKAMGEAAKRTGASTLESVNCLAPPSVHSATEKIIEQALNVAALPCCLCCLHESLRKSMQTDAFEKLAKECAVKALEAVHSSVRAPAQPDDCVHSSQHQ